MGKRKADISDGEQEAEYSQSSSEEERPLKQVRGEKGAKGKNAKSGTSSSKKDTQKKQTTKKGSEKSKPTPKSKASPEGDGVDIDPSVKVDGNGDRYIELGKKRRAIVRSFKGVTFLDIREFYGPEGDEQPSKKGVTLQEEQWVSLKNNGNAIDALFARAQK